MQRMPRMEGLRGVLAIYVMLGHAMPFTDLPGWVTVMFRHGGAAVDMFLALSGLVIVNSLERFGWAFWPFMRARAWRLLPVYFSVLGVSICLLFLGNPLAWMPWVGADGYDIWETAPPPHFVWHLLAHLWLVQGIIPQGLLPYAYVTLLGPAWSLSTEWQFYVLVAVLAPRRLGGFALGVLAAGVAYHVLRLPPWWQFSRAFFPEAAPYLALGLASAVWRRGGGAGVFVACLAGAIWLGALSGVERTLVPLAWLGVMLAQDRGWGAWLEHRVMRWLGAVSYPLYLLNEPVQRGMAMLLAPLAHGDARLFTVLWLPTALALTLAASALMHEAVEKKFMRQRKKNLSPVIAQPVLE